MGSAYIQELTRHAAASRDARQDENIQTARNRLDARLMRLIDKIPDGVIHEGLPFEAIRQRLRDVSEPELSDSLRRLGFEERDARWYPAPPSRRAPPSAL